MSKLRYDWWPYIKAVIRRYPRMQGDLSGEYLRGKNAVDQALSDTKKLPDAAGRLTLIRLVYWDGTHRIPGAAAAVNVSERTAWRWNTEFVELVAKKFGLL